ncbi:MAG: hypothetical protein RL345_2220 [Chloroflexota bacterium]
MSVPIAFGAFVAILAWVADVDKTLLRAYRNWRATQSQ